MKFVLFSYFLSSAFISVLSITCTSKDEPVLVSGFVNKEFTMKITDKVKNCNGYCIGKEVILDATLANGEQAHIRNVHFSCVPKVAKAEKMCEQLCTSKNYANGKGGKSLDRSVGSLKRLLAKEIGDFSYEKAVEKTCCCKDDQCAKRLDGRLRLAMRSNYKIS